MKSPATILVIEDDPTARDVMRRYFEAEGFHVICAANGHEGLRQLYQTPTDLIVLDIGIPGMDGYTVCQRVREISTVPIIMVTARREPEDIVKGLTLGADDYIVKPFNKDVLIARTRANLRRAATPPLQTRSGVSYSDPHVTINLDERRLIVRGEALHLSPIEFHLLEMLVKAAPRVVPYRALLENIWGFEYIDDIDYLRVYIWHLRSKIEPDPKQPTYIINELGVGYRFEPKT
jgi:two-component system KDP operon response regulator KdpE